MKQSKDIIMRQIKFRGKRIDPENQPGKWEEGSLIMTPPPDSIPAFSKYKYPMIWNDQGCYSVDIETVGQFTGLLDKNGKEIFEGDRIKTIDEWYEGDYRVKGFEGVVGFEDGCYGVSGQGKYQYLTLDEVTIENCKIEIIGNIHEGI